MDGSNQNNSSTFTAYPNITNRPASPSVKVLKLRQVQEIVPLSRTTIWRLERAKQFPQRLRLSANLCAWLEEDILAWVASRSRGMAMNPPDQEV